MAPARHYDDYARSRAADSVDSPRSFRALSPFDRSEEASNGAASPTFPLRSPKSALSVKGVEGIAYEPASRNADRPRGEQPQGRLGRHTPSLVCPWYSSYDEMAPQVRECVLTQRRDDGVANESTVKDDAASTLGGFDDFATEEEVRVARNGRTMSFSTASRRESPCHSARSRASSRGRSPSVYSSTRGRGPSSLPGLQIKGSGTDHDALEPLAEEELDPASFDLVAPPSQSMKTYDLENQSELLFSRSHLAIILDDPILLQRFTNFLHKWRPESVPVMVYYLNALKAGLGFTADTAALIKGKELREKADKAFQTLADEDLPAFITQTYIQTVSITVKRRIANILPPELREQSEGLAEVFCLTDPSRPDNPIIFASEQFHETTRYGMNSIIGRNCRFLQGPKTNPLSVRRIRDKLEAGKEHCETFLNYRRDGQPFMNLLMVAPLMDSRGIVRYHIGAQVDVSGLVKSRAGLESFSRMIEEDGARSGNVVPGPHEEKQIPEEGDEDVTLNPMDELRSLSEMLNLPELKVVRESGGAMHRIQQEDLLDSESVTNWHKPRVLVRDDATIGRRDSDPTIGIMDDGDMDNGGRLSGVFQHYLLVRPYPNLRVLFASPNLRVPGMLQSPFMDRIGGSSAVRHTIKQAFADGNGITAKVRWTTRMGPSRGRPRWIHCTPLLGHNKAVGVWMVVITNDEDGSREFS
ncbi:hypothetical protein NLU13_4741 [Sarocladium strictum]|uniref:PAC domain-containing protein n=1 Tax=Sarocladium strictum TaxID=5046 RepID=A0AA39GM22_SARSR|nr:hypothetical protein NLU13_4741 [Sarocladium strictum]